MPEPDGGEIPNTTAPRERDRDLNVGGSKNAGKSCPAYHQHKLIAMITMKSAELYSKNAVFYLL